jgi:hypothetical protein
MNDTVNKNNDPVTVAQLREFWLQHKIPQKLSGALVPDESDLIDDSIALNKVRKEFIQLEPLLGVHTELYALIQELIIHSPWKALNKAVKEMRIRELNGDYLVLIQLNFIQNALARQIKAFAVALSEKLPGLTGVICTVNEEFTQGRAITRNRKKLWARCFWGKDSLQLAEMGPARNLSFHEARFASRSFWCNKLMPAILQLLKPSPKDWLLMQAPPWYSLEIASAYRQSYYIEPGIIHMDGHWAKNHNMQLARQIPTYHEGFFKFVSSEYGDRTVSFFFRYQKNLAPDLRKLIIKLNLRKVVLWFAHVQDFLDEQKAWRKVGLLLHKVIPVRNPGMEHFELLTLWVPDQTGLLNRKPLRKKATDGESSGELRYIQK